jgi:hypothetical protein
MILLHNHHRITALAEFYHGDDPHMPAPEGFDASKYEQYRIIDGVLVLPAPESVTMRQARLALLANGLLDSVDAALAAIPDEQERRAAQIEWEYATEVQRHAPLTLSLGAALGLTDAQLDALFVQAAEL